MKKKNLFVFYGGESVEKDISVITALQAMENIDYTKYNVFPIYIYSDEFYYIGNYSEIQRYVSFDEKQYPKIIVIKDAAFVLKKNRIKPFCRKIDCVLLCVHGGKYEGGSLQGFLDFNNIPFTSCDVLASCLCQSKQRLKNYLASTNVFTVPSFTVSDIEQFKIMLPKLNFSSEKYIVKPDSLGSSIGISVVSNSEEAIGAVEAALLYDNNALVEKYIPNAKEFNCAVLKSKDGYMVGSVDEVSFKNQFLTFDDKYLSDGKYTGKSGKALHSDSPYVSSIKELALETAKYIGSDGVIRCDFLVDKNGKIYLNEVNSVPGSLAYYLFDFDFKTLLDYLIENALQKFKTNTSKIKCFKTSYLDKNISAK